MTPPSWYSLIATAPILLLELGVIARVLLRPHLPRWRFRGPE